YQNAIGLNPEFFWSHNNLGDALLKLERWSEAAEAYQNAIAWRDDLPWSHYNLAEALVKLERWEAAVKAYKRAIEIQPDLPCIYEKLGDALRHQTQIDSQEICQVYHRAVEHNPTNLQVYYKALEVNPKDAKMSLKLADAFRSQGQLDQAVTFYKNTLQLTPEDVDIQVLALHRLGSISQNRGHLEEALGLYRRCGELSPGVDSALAVAAVLEKLGRWTDAVDQYRQVVLEFGECGPASLGLGRALAELERPVEAVVEWRRAVKLGVETPEVHRLLADTLVELGRWSEVVEHWKWLLERYPGAAHWRRRLALALMGLGRWTEAAAQWGEYWRVAPGSGRGPVVDFRPQKKTHGEIDHSQELSITGDLTVEFWLYLRDWPDNWTDIICKYVNDEQNEFCFRLKDETVGQWYYGNGETGKVTWDVKWFPEKEIKLNEWVHVACVRKVGQYGRIYFNGVLRREKDWSRESEAVGTEAPVRLMGSPQWQRFHDGKLSEVRLWNRARSGDEIREGMCEGLTGEEPGLVGLWHGDESDEGVLVDAVGHHHGRLVMAADAGKERPRVGVCGWELSHNAAGRAYTLAQLYGGFAEVELIGCLFPKYGGQVWSPIRGSEIPCHTIRVEDEGRFIEQALGLVLAHPYEVVHLSKPRMPNIILGLLYKLVWGARVIVDIDDEELTFVKASEPVDLREFLESGEGLPQWKHLQGTEWTRIAVGLVREFDGVTVSNRALQERYGGVVIRHARDEARFVPSDDRKRGSREGFGIAQDKKVVLFFGTPKEYKGLVATARALGSLGRKDVVFAIIGDFPDGKLKEELQGIPGVDYVFVGNQPFESIPDVVAVGDICVLLQDADFRVSQFQIPAKLSDALGMGLVVLLSETAAVADVIESGAVVPVAEGDLPAVLDRVLSDEAECNKFRVRGRELLAAEFGFGVNGSRLAEVMDEVRSGVGVLSDELNLLLAGFPAVGSVWSGLRDDKTKLQMVKTDDDSYIYSVYHRLGEALEELGRFDEAGEAYRRAIELQPESAGSVLGLSRVLGRLGKLDEAEKLYPHLAEKLYPHLKDKKIIVYTCNFGNYESVKEPLVVDPRVEYILFTDRKDIKSPTWKVVQIKDFPDNPRRASRLPKILPHQYLPEHDISVYIDSSLTLKQKDVYQMVQECLLSKHLALYPHFKRDCIYDEINACLHIGKINKDKGVDLIQWYKKEKYPKNYGLYENAFIVRRNTPPVRRLNELWLEKYIKGLERDQFYLMYCLWKLSLPSRAITNARQFRESPYVVFTSHNTKYSSQELNHNDDFCLTLGKVELLSDKIKKLENKANQTLSISWSHHEAFNHQLDNWGRTYIPYRVILATIAELQAYDCDSAADIQRQLQTRLFGGIFDKKYTNNKMSNNLITIAYIHNSKKSTEAANNNVDVMKMCSPLAGLDFHVKLYAEEADRYDDTQLDKVVQNFSGSNYFSSKVIPCADTSERKHYNLVSLAILDGCTHVYTRSLGAAVLAAIADLPVILEIHRQLTNQEMVDLEFLAKSGSLVKLVVITKALYLQVSGLTYALDGKITVLDDAADYPTVHLEDFSIQGNSNSCLNIDYGGHTYAGNAVDIIKEFAAAIISDVSFHDRLTENTSTQSNNSFYWSQYISRYFDNQSAQSKPKIYWFVGGEKQIGWAYGINAGRLKSRMLDFEHWMNFELSESPPAPDVAVAFDILIKQKDFFKSINARKRVIRVGGPNPLKIISGGDIKYIQKTLSDVDVVIALSPQLRDYVSQVHDQVFFIPNGLDLKHFHPNKLVPKKDDESFTVGMSASMANNFQKHIKGYFYAEEACQKAGVNFWAIGRGVNQIPHEQLIDEFYSKIDVLIHPVAPGKEGTSNVIMESLALGIPVITTRYAGFHGVALQHGENGLIVRRSVDDLAAAIIFLQENAEIRRNIGLNGRKFAESFHCIDAVAKQYDYVFKKVLMEV
ncbi:MAG: tetratricopeptide repeat protein, partial [Limnospira sp. PMC 894.15]|uniref:tetratricopeptide repeat protein n=1 Tax=Limnospira sp. PMC 894.15 TaxID=2981100 RepID=UPI0028E1226F